MVQTFDIKNDCFVCGKDGTGVNGAKDILIKSTKKPDKIWEAIQSAALQRKDENVLERLRLNSMYKGKVLCYHKISCYQLYIKQRNIQAASNKESGGDGYDERQNILAIHKQVSATLAAQLYQRISTVQGRVCT